MLFLLKIISVVKVIRKIMNILMRLEMVCLLIFQLSMSLTFRYHVRLNVRAYRCMHLSHDSPNKTNAFKDTELSKSFISSVSALAQPMVLSNDQVMTDLVILTAVCAGPSCKTYEFEAILTQFRLSSRTDLQ